MSQRMEATMPRRNPWPFLIVGLVVGFLALTAWSFLRATQGASAVTDRNYYSHGLHFEQTVLEQKTAATLGWMAQLSLTDRQLRIVLKDQRQLPVTAARATLTLSGGSHGEMRLPLEEQAAGAYLAQFPAALHGEQVARLDFERDGARLSKRLILSLP